MAAETEGSTTLNLGAGGDAVREYTIHLPDGSSVRQQIVSLADSQGRQIPLDISYQLSQILRVLEAIHQHMELNT